MSIKTDATYGLQTTCDFLKNLSSTIDSTCHHSSTAQQKSFCGDPDRHFWK